MRLDAKSKAQSRAGEEADKIAAMNYNAKMSALQGAGNMAGSMQQAQFGRDMNKAGQLDAISKFNQANQINLGQRNVDRSNTAQTGNLNAKQNIENVRAANANTQEMHNTGLIQQDYDNRLEKAKSVAGSYEKAADNKQKSDSTQAKNNADMFSSVAKMGISAFGGK